MIKQRDEYIVINPDIIDRINTITNMICYPFEHHVVVLPEDIEFCRNLITEQHLLSWCEKISSKDLDDNKQTILVTCLTAVLIGYRITDELYCDLAKSIEVGCSSFIAKLQRVLAWNLRYYKDDDRLVELQLKGLVD